MLRESDPISAQAHVVSLGLVLEAEDPRAAQGVGAVAGPVAEVCVGGRCLRKLL